MTSLFANDPLVDEHDADGKTFPLPAGVLGSAQAARDYGGEAMKKLQDQNMLAATAAFLNSIGISTTITPGATGFLKGVRIKDGRILTDPACHVSDLLHEAGHIAIFPSRYRHMISGDVGRAQRAMLDDIKRQDLHPDAPLYRAAIQTTDPEATAWAWAAGVHLGLDQKNIIDSHQYERTGKVIRLSLSIGQYIGIHGLAHAGFCAVNRLVAQHRGIPQFPKLAMWLQH